MPKSKMAEHAKSWKSPAERKAAKRPDSPDSKGPAKDAWTKGVKAPKDC